MLYISNAIRIFQTKCLLGNASVGLGT